MTYIFALHAYIDLFIFVHCSVTFFLNHVTHTHTHSISTPEVSTSLTVSALVLAAGSVSVKQMRGFVATVVKRQSLNFHLDTLASFDPNRKSYDCYISLSLIHTHTHTHTHTHYRRGRSHFLCLSIIWLYVT